MTTTRAFLLCSAALASILSVACNSSNPTPAVTSPTPTTPVASAPAVQALSVRAASTSLAQRGATAQYYAVALLSNGTTEDRTAAASWTSTNQGVATVSAQGMVTAQGEGDAVITASLNTLQGSLPVAVRLGAAPPPPTTTSSRTPDPPAGQRLPLPSGAQAQIERIAAARMDLLVNQSCPRNLKYVRNPWLDYMIDELRKLDTRWGYNAKPNRTAADNSGVPVEVAGDEITYHFGPGPDEGSTDVYPIDILLGHCGPTPSLTFRVFTGEEPVRWTGAGRF